MPDTKKTPHHLFRYFDLEGAKATLRDNLLRCSSPTALNDPFDFNPEINDGREGYFENLLQIQAKANGITEDVGPFAKQYINEGRSKDYNGYKRALGNIFYSQYSTWCFSNTPSSLLLWSHYSDQHKGICLGFSTKRLNQQFRKVKYTDQRPIVNVVKSGDRLQAYDPTANLDSLTSKSRCWRYEREWRIIERKSETDLHSDENGYYNIPINDSLSSIRIGCEVDKKDQQELVNLVSTISRLNIYEMSLNPYKYQLKKHRI
jgi:hypothetical protein